MTSSEHTPILRWPSILGTDAYQPNTTNNGKKQVITRTITSEEDGTIKDAQTLAKDIAIESSKFYMSMLSEEEQKSINLPTPDPECLKAVKSVPSLQIPGNILDLIQPAG